MGSTFVMAAQLICATASKLKIPQRRWDWADSESEDLGSDIDTVKSEDIFMTPRKKPGLYVF
jgi:hypothetical protein